MSDVIDRILTLPWGLAFAALWAGVMVRANATYWIGRGLAAGTAHSRWASLLTSPTYARAQALYDRWGVLAVPFSFCTIGVQSLVQLAAGVTRMPLTRYLPAVAVGCAIWAALYSTVGLALVATWLEAGGAWALTAALLLVAVVAWVRLRRSGSVTARG